MTKKILGFLIAAAMLLAIVPAAAFAKNAAPASARDAQLAFWDFETDPAAAGWTFVDQDGDGYNWLWVEDTASGAPIAASGTHTLRSFSYYSGAGALNPDNWAITPEIALPEGGEATLSYHIASYSSSYPETYSILVYVENSDEPVAVTEDLTSPASVRVFEERTVDLSEYAGQTVKVAFRHYNCSNQFRVFLDDIAIVSTVEPPVDPTEPPAGPELIYGAYFEEGSDPVAEGWQFADQDGDGRTWQWKSNTFGVAYEGTGIIASYSYSYPTGNLNPDNWAISPAVELPDDELSVTFYAKGYLADYCSEHFAVYAGTSDDTAEMTEILPETVTTGSYVQYTADLSDFANETVYIAIRHFNTTPGEEALCVDQFEVWGKSGAEPTEPPVDPTEPPAEPTEPPVEPTEPPVDDHKIVGYYFETDPEEAGWQFVDSDGDGLSWFWVNNSTYYAYEGYGAILSASYMNGIARNPDNWAISPAIELLDADLSVTFYAKGSSLSYPEEHFAVYVGTDDDIESMTEIIPETVATSSFVQYSADLSDYANETVFIAIRHFNCYDQMRLCVDQFEVWGSEGEPSDEPVVIENIEIENFVEPVWGEEAFVELTVTDGAHYSIRSAEWQWWTMEDDGVLGSGDVFDSEEKTYYMYIEIVPDEGYVFSDNTVITINGDAGLVDSKGWMEYSRYCWLNTIDFSVTEPEAELIGDVDGDGEVIAADALLALRHIMSLDELDEEQLAHADVNGDGEVTIVDSLLIQRYAMGVIESFPIED